MSYFLLFKALIMILIIRSARKLEAADRGSCRHLRQIVQSLNLHQHIGFQQRHFCSGPECHQ